MKSTIIAIAFLLLSNQSFAQSKQLPISIGYFAPFLLQQGIKIGTELEITQWHPEPIDGKTKVKSLFFSPQIAYFTNPDRQSNYLINSEIGLKKQTSGKLGYSAVSIGLGYAFAQQTLGGSVNLGSGSTSENTTQSFSYFLPTLNYEIGKDADRGLGYYFQAFVGRQLSSKIKSSSFVGVELGLKFNL